MENKIKIEGVLATEGVYISATVGKSMYPMLRAGRDKILVSPKCGRLKKYDIPLYRRGDNYVLHRVIKVLPGSGYNIRGDNCFATEKNVPEEAVIGVLTEFFRDGKSVNTNGFGYKLYSRIWVALHPLICALKTIRRVTLKIFVKNKAPTKKSGGNK